MPEDQNQQATAPATNPEPEQFVLRVNPRELAPVLAALALQHPDRRDELQKLDASRDKAAVYLRDTGRPADLQFRPLSDFHPDLCLIAAHALDADAGAVICVAFQTKGEEINFAFEAPAREMPEQEQGAPVEPTPPATPATMSFTREELAQILQRAVAPLAQEIEALKKEREEKKPVDPAAIYAARMAEYEAAVHENILSELKARKKQDPEEVFDNMLRRNREFTKQLFEQHAETQALAAQHMAAPQAPEKASLGENIVNKVLDKVDQFTSGAGKEPFMKKVGA